MKTIAIAGCGKLGNIVADAILNGILPEYELTGVYSRTLGSAQALAEKMVKAGKECRVAEQFEQLIALKPDYLIEAASPAAMREWALPTLKQGISIITLSIGAFADDAFYAEVADVARKAGTRVYMASGATGGFDVLNTVTLMGGARAHFFNEKNPNALRGTAVFDEALLGEQRQVFEGTACEAIELFPTKVNVTVAASRASVGPAAMHVRMLSTPGFVGDTQKVEIENEQVHAVIDVYSATAEIAGWSVVSTLLNISSPVMLFQGSRTGGNTFRITNMITAAIAPVTTKVATVVPMILPAFLALSILAMADAMEQKTMGTTIQNIRLMNTVPRGSSTRAPS